VREREREREKDSSPRSMMATSQSLICFLRSQESLSFFFLVLPLPPPSTFPQVHKTSLPKDQQDQKEGTSKNIFFLGSLSLSPSLSLFFFFFSFFFFFYNVTFAVPARVVRQWYEGFCHALMGQCLSFFHSFFLSFSSHSSLSSSLSPFFFMSHCRLRS